MFRSLEVPSALCLFAALALVIGCTDDAGSDDADAAGAGGGAGSGAAGGGDGDAGQGGAGGGSASCIDDDGCPPGARCDTADGSCRPSCADDRDCGPRARCGEGNFCVDLPACEPGGVCAAGAVCSCNAVCEPVTGDPCQRDLQCDVADYCDACTGTCKTRAGQCEPCADDTACDTRSACHPVGSAGLRHCLRRCDDRCDALGPGYECLDAGNGASLCVPMTRDCAAPTECEDDTACPIGRFCNDRQVCQPGCTDDTGCPNAQICQSGRCQPPCGDDTDCLGDALCEPDGRCRVPGGCDTSTDCPDPETYCDRATQMCAPGCQIDDDCQDATKECIANACVPRGCTAAFQCSFGEVCELETNRCVLAEGRHCEPDCDPMDENSCGGEGRRCLSLQDEEENPLGDYCFEPCAEDPNACPQGYQCVELMDQDGNAQGNICIRRCDLDPFR